MFEQDLGKVMPVGRLGLIVMNGCTELGKKVDKHLVEWRENRRHEMEDKLSGMDYTRDSFIIPFEASRFGTGEGKARLKESVRGYDLYILVDVCNNALSYSIAGKLSFMSPDEHFQDLKRVISAVGGVARRINVIMPFLYEGRQQKRDGIESLDCAMMLRELTAMGVDSILTFDAHDARVQNAIPMNGFENIQPVYQFVKGLLDNVDDLEIDPEHLMVISPDEAGTGRAIYMANNLGVDMGMFYQRRDYSRYVNGRHPIVANEFLGKDVSGKDLLIIDDMISSGDSILDVARELKHRGARKIFMCSTFGLFTNGLKKFDNAYEQGFFDKLLTTDLIYQSPELLSKEYYINCGMGKYIAFFIEHMNHDASISSLLKPSARIQKNLERYRNKQKEKQA